jgi:SARP family transcriptional regulator, regulator of embCAB operon
MRVVRCVTKSHNAGMNTGERIEINLFGGTVLRGRTETRLSDGEFAVVAQMAFNGNAASRDEWCDVLWPDRDAESAARLLKVFVHRIRTKLATQDVIETRGRCYRIGAGVRVDMHSLEHLVRKHTSGAFRCDDAQLANMQRAFEGFVARGYLRLALLETFDQVERRLIATGIELGRALVADALARHDGTRALALAEALAGIDPYDDVAAELLIRTHLELGRLDAAARSFRSFCRTLSEELNVAPPRHLAQLVAGKRALSSF